MNVEMLQQMIGSNLKEVTGQITSLTQYKYEEQGEHGPSSFQPGKFKLDNGEIVAVVFKNQFEHNGGDMKPRLNKRITISSKSGPKGLSGVKVAEFRDAPQLVITATAIFSDPDGAAPAQSTAAGAGPSASQPTGRTPAKSAPRLTPEQGILEAKKFVARNRTMVLIAMKAAESVDAVYKQAYNGQMPESTYNIVLNALLYGSSQNGVTANLPLEINFQTLTAVKHAPQKGGGKQCQT